MTPFYGWGSTASRLEPLQGGSLLFTIKFPEIPGTHLINLGRMKGWVDLEGNVMRVMFCQGRRKDYPLLITEWMVYISFVINAFKKFFVLLMLIKCFCVYIFIWYLLLSFSFCFLRMWSILVFRSAKWWLPPLVVLVWMVGEPPRVPAAGDLVK